MAADSRRALAAAARRLCTSRGWPRTAGCQGWLQPGKESGILPPRADALAPVSCRCAGQCDPGGPWSTNESQRSTTGMMKGRGRAVGPEVGAFPARGRDLRCRSRSRMEHRQFGFPWQEEGKRVRAPGLKGERWVASAPSVLKASGVRSAPRVGFEETRRSQISTFPTGRMTRHVCSNRSSCLLSRTAAR